MSCVTIQVLKFSSFLLTLGYELNYIFEDMVRVLRHWLENIISVVLFLHFHHHLFLNFGLDAMIMMLDDDDND